MAVVFNAVNVSEKSQVKFDKRTTIYTFLRANLSFLPE